MGKQEEAAENSRDEGNMNYSLDPSFLPAGVSFLFHHSLQEAYDVARSEREVIVPDSNEEARPNVYIH